MKNSTIYPGRVIAGTALMAAGFYNTVALKKPAMGFLCLLVSTACFRNSIHIDV